MINERTPSYVGTVVNDQDGLDKIKLVRTTVSKVNKQLRESGVTAYRYTVVARGRLGRGNLNADLYRRGTPDRAPGVLHRWSSQTIRPEHSVRFDVYVSKRRDYSYS